MSIIDNLKQFVADASDDVLFETIEHIETEDYRNTLSYLVLSELRNRYPKNFEDFMMSSSDENIKSYFLKEE